MMKAFRVYYDTPSKSSNMVVLAKEKEEVPSAIANKDRGFKIGGRHKDLYRVNIVEEMPLSNVMVSDLSVTELLEFQKWMERNKEEELPVQMEWEEFAGFIDKVSDLSKNGWIFQFHDSDIIIYNDENVFRYCDNIEEFADFIENVRLGLV